MELKEGMYVRTNNGNIRKITELVNGEYIDEPDYYVDKVLIDIVQDDKTEDTIYMEKWLFDENIIKSSYNIIDLIEVGDYVNGNKVTKLGFDKLLLHCKTIECHQEDLSRGYKGVTFIYTNNDIKDVITKEQFEACKYVVERDE